MSTPGPQQPQPEIAPQLRAADPVYNALMQALHGCSRDETVTTLAAVTAAVELAGELAVASGLLWSHPSIVAALRGLVDGLEQRQKDEPLPPRKTLREFFQSARPPFAN
jgi:hypothetical protein